RVNREIASGSWAAASAGRSGRRVVEVANLRKLYGSTVAVDDVSFEVFEGEIFGLIGPNGAGKTTTMECVEGVRKADTGRTSVLGLDPARDANALQERIGDRKSTRLNSSHVEISY